MSLIVIIFCSLLFVFQGEAGSREVKEDEHVTIDCRTDSASIFFWFRLKENDPGFEHIATYSKSKKLGTEVDPGKFKVTDKSLELKQFKRQKDSGTYGCVSVNNNMLKFSVTTELRGEPVLTTIKTRVQTAPIQAVTSMTTALPECTQKTKVSGQLDVILGCEQQILIPLAASCVFLILLLIITIFYCNRIRTRRCPHHYKRQPRIRPAGHKTLPDHY